MPIETIITHLIKATNAFDVETALKLFADDAVIDDVSVGEKFKNKNGVRKYLEDFFVGYETKSRIESVEVIDPHTAKVKLDFTGKFGHESGGLDVTISADGLITRIDAYLD